MSGQRPITETKRALWAVSSADRASEYELLLTKYFLGRDDLELRSLSLSGPGLDEGLRSTLYARVGLSIGSRVSARDLAWLRRELETSGFLASAHFTELRLATDPGTGRVEGIHVALSLVPHLQTNIKHVIVRGNMPLPASVNSDLAHKFIVPGQPLNALDISAFVDKINTDV